MTVTIGSLTFDHASYDARGDVLYLHVGDPQEAAGSEETPEGHVLRFDADGEVIGLLSGGSRLDFWRGRRVEWSAIEPVVSTTHAAPRRVLAVSRA
jgi:hypothetical protein